MASFTQNLNLKLPAQTDFYNVDDFNGNFQKIDEGTVPLKNASNTWAFRWWVFPTTYRELHIETGVGVDSYAKRNHAFTPQVGVQYRVEATVSGSGTLRIRGNDEDYKNPNRNDDRSEWSLGTSFQNVSHTWTQTPTGGNLVFSGVNLNVTFTRIAIYRVGVSSAVWELDFSRLDKNGATLADGNVREIGSSISGSEYYPAVRRQARDHAENSITMLPVTDLNNVKHTGFYVVNDKDFNAYNTPSGVTVQGDGNLSGQNVAVLQVMRVDGVRIMQVLHHNSQGQWRRSFQETSGWSAWVRILDSTTTATPAAHTHNASDINTGTLDITRIPTGNTSSTVCLGNDNRLSDARTPTSHNHSASDITSGMLSVVRGGTGRTELTGSNSLRNDLGLGTSNRTLRENGTFTPTLTLSPRSASNESVSLTNTFGNWYREGNLVFFELGFTTNSSHTPSGDLIIGGLPSSVAAPSNSVISSVFERDNSPSVPNLPDNARYWVINGTHFQSRDTRQSNGSGYTIPANSLVSGMSMSLKGVYRINSIIS